MYLGLLNNEQKSLFLSIAIYLARSDNDFSKEEKEIIQSYCDEMNISDKSYVPYENITEIIAKIDEISTLKEKKIIVFEAIGLAMVDQEYSDDEKNIIMLMNTYFGLNNSFIEQCEVLLSQYIEFQTQFNQLVLFVDED